VWDNHILRLETYFVGKEWDTEITADSTKPEKAVHAIHQKRKKAALVRQLNNTALNKLVQYLTHNPKAGAAPATSPKIQAYYYEELVEFGRNIWKSQISQMAAVTNFF
jgi:hypothetical protein